MTPDGSIAIWSSWYLNFGNALSVAILKMLIWLMCVLKSVPIQYYVSTIRAAPPQMRLLRLGVTPLYEETAGISFVAIHLLVLRIHVLQEGRLCWNCALSSIMLWSGSFAALEIISPNNEKIITRLVMINLVLIGQKDRAGFPMAVESYVITSH